MNNSNKILVIAGTHQREIEFSHPIADLLIDRYNKDPGYPLDTIIGEDGATKALVWDTKYLTIAKLFTEGNGIPTKEWLNNLSFERLIYLNKHKINCSNQARPPGIAESFGGESQWTSVTGPLIQKYSPLFFIDLHSFHEYSRGKEGKGLSIHSHADRSLDPIVLKALEKAQFDYPEIYGESPTTFTSTKQIQNELYPKYFSKEDLVELAQSHKIGRWQRKQFYKKTDSLHREAVNMREQELSAAYDKGWFFLNHANPETRGDTYVFEARHWQSNQQEATARFIMEYLIPEVKNYSRVIIQ